MTRKSQNSNLSRRGPPLGGSARRNLRPPRMNYNNGRVTYQVTFETGALSTNPSGISTGFVFVDPLAYLSYQLGQVGSLFQEYKVLKYNLRWVPLVGATTGGSVRMAYIDNAEMIYKTASGSYSAGDVSILTQQAGTSHRGPLWQEVNFSMPNNIGKRRNWYQADSSPLTNSEQVDRVVQAMGLVYITGPASATALGYLAITLSVEFRLPMPVTSSPVLLSIEDRRQDAGQNPQPPLRKDPPSKPPGDSPSI